MNLHRIITYGPDWRCFLRRDEEGRIENGRTDCRRANIAWAACHDRELRHLVDLGDVEGARRRLAVLGICADRYEVAALVEEAQL